MKRKHTHAALPLLVWAVLCSSVIAFDWETRRALSGDQTPEWTEAGFLPRWDVTVNEHGDGFRIDGDDKQHFRGAVLVGAPLELPEVMPGGMRVRLRFQTFCELHDPPRAGQPSLAFYTPQTWDRFSESTEPTIAFDHRADDQRPLFSTRIGDWGADVTDPHPWQSDELVKALRDYAGQTVIMAIVWSAHHFNAQEWAEFDGIEVVTQTKDDLQREFFASLEVANVTDAVADSDWSRTTAELADYYRNRTTPPAPPLPATSSTAAADRVVDHVFSLVHCPPHQLPAEIAWNEDPFDYDQWAISLNRHFHWRTLGSAYAGTGDERYAIEFAAQLESWIDAMPVQIGRTYVEGPYSASGRLSLSLDAGIRMADTWFPAFYYFLPSENFTDEQLVAMLQSFRRHAIYLMDPRHFRSGSNWGAMEASGLLHIGCMLPEFREANTWRDTAIERLYGELDAQVYADGAQMELTPGYHGVTLRNVLSAVEVARRCDVSLPDDFVEQIERMFDYYVRITMPNRTTPNLNDSGSGSILGQLAQGLKHFPDREDFRFLTSNGTEGSPPPYTSTQLPWAGWTMMRSGWERDACYLLLDGGPYGTGHQHEDKLSIIVQAFGKTLIAEAGTYAYDTSDWRKYVLSTRAHNTIMVDGHGQRHKASRQNYSAERPLDTPWSTSPAFDFAEGVYDLGYGDAENVPVEHRRSILFVKPRLWLVVDRLTSADDLPHIYESLFHLDATDAQLDAATGRIVTANPEGPNVALIPVQSDGWTARIVKGQIEPVVQGWLPTGKHNVLRAVPTAVYSRQVSGDTSIAYLIAPFREGESAPTVRSLGVASEETFAFEVTMPNGGGYVIRWNDESSTPYEVEVLGEVE